MNRKEQILRHLLDDCKVIGGRPRLRPRGHKFTCPISNFIPDMDSNGHEYTCSFGTYHCYGQYPYQVHYTPSDTEWWNSLYASTRIKYTNWLINRLKELTND